MSEPSFLELHRHEYAEQVKWLLFGRVLIVLACLVILLVYEEGSPRLFAPAYAVVVAALVLAAVELVYFRRARRLERFVLTGVCLDVAFATLLAYLTGGIYNVGFAFLYFGSILSAVILLSARAAFVVASVATVAMAGCALAYWWAAHSPLELPFVPPPLYRDVQLRWGRITANLIGVMLAYHGVAYLGSRLPHRISRSRILYDEVLDRMRDGLVAIDRSGRIAFVNSAACRLLNWSAPGDLVGRRFEDVLRRREDRTVLEILSRGEDLHAELELLLRNRGPQPVEVVTTVLRDARGRVRGVIGIFRDLSTKLRLQEMETRVAQLSSSEEMALGIAHEIRTPLASIRGAIQELAAHSFTDDADRRLAEIVRRESDRLDRILQQFLDFARMRPPVRQRLDLWTIVHETVVLLARRPAAEGVHIECEPSGPFVIEGDSDLLRQALLNVSTNAVEALEGEGRLVLRGREVDLPEISEGPERRVGTRRGVEVVVDDDGRRPVPPEDRSRIFLPFFTTKRGGLGLGLALTQKIARLHGGDVTCEASDLGGTCFRFRLPAAPAEGSDAFEGAAEPAREGTADAGGVEAREVRGAD